MSRINNVTLIVSNTALYPINAGSGIYQNGDPVVRHFDPYKEKDEVILVAELEFEQQATRLITDMHFEARLSKVKGLADSIQDKTHKERPPHSPFTTPSYSYCALAFMQGICHLVQSAGMHERSLSPGSPSEQDERKKGAHSLKELKLSQRTQTCSISCSIQMKKRDGTATLAFFATDETPQFMDTYDGLHIQVQNMHI